MNKNTPTRANLKPNIRNIALTKLGRYREQLLSPSSLLVEVSWRTRDSSSSHSFIRTDSDCELSSAAFEHFRNSFSHSIAN